MSPIITLSPFVVAATRHPKENTELENYIVASYVWHVQSCKILFGHEKVGSESFNSQMAIICPGGKLNNFKFQILLATGDARLFTMVLNGIFKPLKSRNVYSKIIFNISCNFEILEIFEIVFPLRLNY